MSLAYSQFTYEQHFSFNADSHIVLRCSPNATLLRGERFLCKQRYLVAFRKQRTQHKNMREDSKLKAEICRKYNYLIGICFLEEVAPLILQNIN